MRGSIDSGGETHMKYSHFYYPRKIEVLCSNCAKPSMLTNIDAPTDIEFFMDISPFRREWNFKCNYCLTRKIISWDKIIEFELLNKIDIRSEIIWAWNSNHLEYLLGVFSANEDKTHNWSFYRNYINKDWLQKTKNKSDQKKLFDLLTTNQKIYNPKG